MKRMIYWILTYNHIKLRSVDSISRKLMQLIYLFLLDEYDNILPRQKCEYYLGHLHYHGLTLFQAWIRNCFHYNVWDEITLSFLNFRGTNIEAWKWINNSIPHFSVGLKLIHVSKQVPRALLYNNGYEYNLLYWCRHVLFLITVVVIW